ncbi:hypothetical protein [Brevibacterium luteolum]|uniref:hypothetical protein n=1 Tax=Brevibacterium luteolum TaxID=199591 RepID=UPI00223BAB97|nr:hypothetical protein [Brevibacterium luteolum]MCT1830688.1 hypothetical protein [Brevibacterium luteolum]
MTKSHIARCSEAVRTPRDKCECSCAGKYHGGPHTFRARAFIQPEDDRKRYSRNVVVLDARKKARNAPAAEFTARCTDFLATEAIDALIHLDDVPREKQTDEAIQRMVAPFVSAIMDAALSESESKALVRTVQAEHLLCTVCATLLEIRGEIRAVGKNTARRIVDAVFDLLEQRATTQAQGNDGRSMEPDARPTDDEVEQAVPVGLTAGDQAAAGEIALKAAHALTLSERVVLQPAAKAALRLALERTITALLDLVLDPASDKTLQLLGLIFCPDINAHPEVVKYCALPIGRELLTAALVDWIGQGLPQATSLLAGRRKR